MPASGQAVVADPERMELEQVLHIVVGGKNLLVRASEIRAVVRPARLTAVPMGPAHVIGLANIHGQIVCIIDVGGVTSLPACNRAQTSRTRFLLLHHPVMHVGIWADEVCSIRRVNKALLLAASGAEKLVQVEIDGMLYELFACAGLFR